MGPDRAGTEGMRAEDLSAGGLADEGPDPIEQMVEGGEITFQPSSTASGSLAPLHSSTLATSSPLPKPEPGHTSVPQKSGSAAAQHADLSSSQHEETKVSLAPQHPEASDPKPLEATESGEGGDFTEWEGAVNTTTTGLGGGSTSPAALPGRPGPRYDWDIGWSKAGEVLSKLRSLKETGAGEAGGARAGPEERRAAMLGILPEVNVSLGSRRSADDLEALLVSSHDHKEDPPQNLSKALNTILRSELIVAVGLYAAQVVCSLALPLLAFAVLKWTENEQPEQWLGFLLVAAIGVSNAGSIMAKELFIDRCNTVGSWTMTAVSGVVYRKSLRYSTANAFSANVGRISELVSGGADALTGYWQAMISFWLQPVEILILVIMLYFFVGWATLGGVFVVIIAFSLSSYAGRNMERVTQSRTVVGEQHSQLVSEALVAMKAIKYNAWEKQFGQRIHDVKSGEMEFWKWTGQWIAMVNVSSNPSVDLISLAVVVLLTAVMDRTLTPSVLAAYWVLLALLHGKIFEFPESVRQIAEGRAALARFQEFLDSEEVKVSNKRNRNAELVVQSATFAWPGSGSKVDLEAEKQVAAKGDGLPVLQEVSLRIRTGSVVGISGAVGSGKSTLILGLLGELPSVKGAVNTLLENGVPTALVSQTAWIFTGTMRDNVVMDKPFEEKWYVRVCDACALSVDFSLLPEGDQTMIGERGVNLSGGQKQRVSLARAAYSKAPVVILDDPLSALDARVRAQVWKKCVLRLLAGKTRVVVTHDQAALQDCDEILTLEGGKVLSRIPSKEQHSAGNGTWHGVHEAAPGSPALVSQEAIPRHHRPETLESPTGEHPSIEETSSSLFFLRHCVAGVGGLKNAGIILLILMFEIGMVEGGVYFLSRWADTGLRDPAEAANQKTYFLIAYTLFVLLEQISCGVRNLLYVEATTKAVMALHGGMVSSLLHCPITFLDNIQAGGVVHQYSQLLSQLDLPVLMATDFFLYGLCFSIGIGVLTCYYIYWLMVVTIICSIFLLYLTSRFEHGQELRKMRDTLRTPILEHFTATLDGLSAVRAYKSEEFAQRELYSRFDTFTKTNLACMKADSWLRLRSMLVTAVFYMFSGLGIILHAEDVGLLSSTFSLSSADAAFLLLNICFGAFSVQIMIQRSLELKVIARTRQAIWDQIRQTPQEGPYETPDSTVAPANWPKDGSLSLQGVVLRYPASCVPAVNGLTVSVSAGEKISVVGRTGAGKSSIVVALTRTVEVEDGVISFSGVDSAKLGLTQLRGSMSVVSQDPIMFAGSIRRNLDPFSEYDDERLWRVLASAGLKKPIEFRGGLETEVADLGENMSLGERQLLCLARALLRDRKLLLLDEATASLDEDSERKVLAAVKAEASQATVIQIAHRLNSVVESDRIVVMEKGVAVEVGPPSELLSKPESLFGKMVDATGPANASQLRSKMQK